MHFNQQCMVFVMVFFSSICSLASLITVRVYENTLRLLTWLQCAVMPNNFVYQSIEFLLPKREVSQAIRPGV